MNYCTRGIHKKNGEPLRWLIHGGPGIGKTKFVMNIIKEELFQGVMKWNMSVEYQIVALQAVMAELLGGDTIHHACGIPVYNGRESHEDNLQKTLDCRKTCPTVEMAYY